MPRYGILLLGIAAAGGLALGVNNTVNPACAADDAQACRTPTYATTTTAGSTCTTADSTGCLNYAIANNSTIVTFLNPTQQSSDNSNFYLDCSSPVSSYLPANGSFTQSGTLTSGLATVTGLTTGLGGVDASGAAVNTSHDFYPTIVPGMPVSGTGIPATTTVAAVSSTSGITLSQAATASGAQTLTFQSYTVTGSGYPVVWKIQWPTAQTGPGVLGAGQPNADFLDNSGIRIKPGCTGSGWPATSCDLTIIENGDGVNSGFRQDAFKISGGAGDRNLSICGSSLNCGPRESQTTAGYNHQDAIQLQTGDKVSFFDPTIGNWSGKLPTCEGGGGAPFLSSSGTNPSPTSINFTRLNSIACNHGLNVGKKSGAYPNPITGTMTSSYFRSGFNTTAADAMYHYVGANPSPISLNAVDEDPAFGGAPVVGMCHFATTPIQGAATYVGNTTSDLAVVTSNASSYTFTAPIQGQQGPFSDPFGN